MTKKVSPETYLDEAEKLLQELAPQKGFTVWRGLYPEFKNKHRNPTDEIIIVGIESEHCTNPDIKLSLLCTHLEEPSRGVRIEIMYDDVVISCMPFSEGWNPLEQLKNCSESLPDFS